jgi:CubicO group peptidase (beta-lactamase class C family)
VLIVDGQIVESGAVGVRAVGYSEAVTPNDRWHIGSITKSMTATLTGVLVEKGNVDWNTTVGEVFPDLVETIRPEYVAIRIDELLTQTTGLPTDVMRSPTYEALRTSDLPLNEQRRQWIAELLQMAPEGPRGMHNYSNANYVVLGAMLETVTGKVWEYLMQQHLFDPLGMTSTGFGPPGTTGATPDQPRGHIRVNGELNALQPESSADNPAVIGPAGTVHTTLDDFAVFLTTHLAGARGKDSIVSAATFDKLHSSVGANNYGMGWTTGERSWAGGRYLQHSGSNQVWFATTWIAPERNFAMLVVTNAGGGEGFAGADEAIRALSDRFDAAADLR